MSLSHGGARPSPSQLSRYLRTADDPDLRRRRTVAALSLAGATLGQVVSAYQVGLLRPLPDPPGPFDADRVDASDYAYRTAATPDGFLVVATYAVTAALAAAGGEDRPRHHPVLPLLLAAKVAAAAGRDARPVFADAWSALPCPMWLTLRTTASSGASLRSTHLS